jgi:DNA-binding transcriptional LysR family regulator
MDRLDAMHMFVRVVETGSFTKVAQEFATTQPTVTKQVAAMEARLKVRLLNRNTRGVSLTEAGALYYEKCKIIVSDVAEAENVVKVRQTQVRVSCASAARWPSGAGYSFRWPWIS